ncbi:MAG: AEC family transporter [Lentisphaeria bacterium]|jgi:predicted permease
MASTLFWNLLAILLLMAPGVWLRRTGVVTDEAAARMARFVFTAAYPCLIFAAISERYTAPALLRAWALPVGVFGIVVVGWLAGLAVARLLRFATPAQKHAFIFQCGFNNYSFLALPLVEALWGAEAGAMLLLSTVGAELGVWTLGVTTLGGHGFHWRQLLTLARRPPLLALAAAGAWLAVRDLLGLPPVLETLHSGTAGTAIFRAVKLLGGATIPLSMTVAGCSLAVLPPRELRNRLVWLASALRLLAIPALVLLGLRLLPIPADQLRVLSVVAVMPAAVASISLCKVYGGDEHLTAGTVLLTHLAAAATVPILLALALG